MNLTPILNAIIALVGVIITAVLIPYIKTKLTAEKRKTLSALIQTAVTAAEQIYKGSGRGKEKKIYVVSLLKSHGIDVDADEVLSEVDAMIEAAVYELGAF